MSFGNPIVGGTDALIRNAIHSRNYVPGLSGWSINKDGFAEFNNVAINGGELIINDANGDTIASVNNQGVASFQDLTVVQSPTIAGKDFQTQIIDPLPRGLITYGRSNSLTFTGLSGEYGLIELAWPDLPLRTYSLHAQINGQFTGGAGNNFGINIRYTYATPGNTPTKPNLSSTHLFQVGREVATIGAGQTFPMDIDFELPNGAGAYRFLMTAVRLQGSGGFNSGTTALTPVFFSLKDIGPTGLNTGVINDGSGGSGGPVQTYTKNYFPLWSRAFNGNGTPGSYSNPNSIYQGYNQSDGNGVRKSMIGYDWATIQSDLSGATIQSCLLTMYFAHWYNNSGGTANIGYHNYSGGSAPGSYQTVGFIHASGGWPKPGLRTVDLTAAGLGTVLKSGAAKGVTLGDGASTNAVYYGYASGATQSNPPYLTITYTK